MTYTPAAPWFGEALKAAGWDEVIPNVEFRKGHRRLILDTSSWIELHARDGVRIFDVPVPEIDRTEWTLRLIDRLFWLHESNASPSVGRTTPHTPSRRKKKTGWLMSSVLVAGLLAAAWIAATVLTGDSFGFALP